VFQSSHERPTKPRRFVALPADAVKAVYFGWQMSQEIRTIMVSDIASLNIQKFIMEPHRSKFALIETAYDKWKPHTAAFEDLIRDRLRIGKETGQKNQGL
jgi:hypothetical protein